MKGPNHDDGGNDWLHASSARSRRGDVSLRICLSSHFGPRSGLAGQRGLVLPADARSDRGRSIVGSGISRVGRTMVGITTVGTIAVGCGGSVGVGAGGFVAVGAGGFVGVGAFGVRVALGVRVGFGVAVGAGVRVGPGVGVLGRWQSGSAASIAPFPSSSTPLKHFSP